MATKKKKQPPAPAQPAALPGVADDVVTAAGPAAYRVDRGSVKQQHVDAVLAGRADLERFTQEQFTALMRVLVHLRIEAFTLPFDTFTGGTCAVVRKTMKTVRPSEMARAIIGAGRDPWAQKRKPNMMQILARAPEYLVLADDKAPPPPREKAVVVAEYLRTYEKAIEVDWWQDWPKPEDVDRHSVPVLEHFIAKMNRALDEKGGDRG